jgi:hypothetical protein
VHAAHRGAGDRLERAWWALIYLLALATFSAYLVKVMLQAFQVHFEGLLRGRELAFGWDQKIRPLIKKAIPPTSKATPKLSISQTPKRA